MAELVVIIQLVIGAIGVYIAWRSHKSAELERMHRMGLISAGSGGGSNPTASTHEGGYCAVRPKNGLSFSASSPASLSSPYPLTTSVCSNLFVVDALGSQAETIQAQAQAQANNTYSSSSGSSSSSPQVITGFVSEDQELGFLVSVLNTYYLYAYNLYWSGSATANNPFTNNQCLSLLQQQNNQQQYEKLSQDIEAYAAISARNNSNKTVDTVYALVMTYFITRVRIIQIQNATLDLSSSCIYNSSNNLITFQPQFITVVAPQLGSKTKALITSGSCTPQQLASTMLLPGEHNPTFDNLSTGKTSYTFICGSAS
jgi:hypothetical protein